MLGRLILIALQIIVAWVGAEVALRYVPVSVGGDPRLLVHGAIFGVIIWMVGLIGAQALKGVSTPSMGTLIWSVAGGLIGGALVVAKIPSLVTAQTGIAIVPMFVPLVLALIGYAVKR